MAVTEPPREAIETSEAGLERRLLTEQSEIEAFVPAWRRLAETRARSAFQSPDWLLACLSHYERDAVPFVLTWWVGSRLVGVAPLVRRVTRHAGLRVRELRFWGNTGTPLRGSVDILAGEIGGGEGGSAEAVLARDMLAWLADAGLGWDLFHYLRVPAGSAFPAVFQAAGLSHVSLTSVLPSDSYVIELPSTPGEQSELLGPKARHNIRTETRAFERSMQGRYELVTDPDRATELVHAIQSQAGARWGVEDLYFRRDPRFASFAADATRAMFTAGQGYAFIARDPDGIQACLVNLWLNRRAVSLLLGVNPSSRYRGFSLGKVLFHLSIEEAIARRGMTYDLLWANGYKASFWHAQPARVESGVGGRGLVGRLGVAYVSLRRLRLPRILGRATRRSLRTRVK